MFRAEPTVWAGEQSCWNHASHSLISRGAMKSEQLLIPRNRYGLIKKEWIEWETAHLTPSF